MPDAPDTGAQQPTANDADAQQNGTDKEPDWKAEAEKWKGLARKHEEASKANATKASEFDRLAEASKTELERAQEAANQIPTLQAQNNRLQVALEKGLTATQAARLVGESLEDLRADADEFLKDLGGQQQTHQQSTILQQASGQRPTASPERSMDDWLRSQRRG